MRLLYRGRVVGGDLAGTRTSFNDSSALCLMSEQKIFAFKRIDSPEIVKLLQSLVSL